MLRKVTKLGRHWWDQNDEFERIGFQHETEEFLVRFGLEHNGFAIEAIIKEDFIWWQVAETSITQNETVVNVADVSNEKVVILKDGLEVD